MIGNNIRKLTMSDIPGMSYEELEHTIDHEIEEAGKIDGSLNNAKATVQATGIYADPVWFQKAKSALKIKRKLISKMQQRLKDMKREMYHNEDVGKRFMKAAKLLLKDESYQMILDMAANTASEPKEEVANGNRK